MKKGDQSLIICVTGASSGIGRELSKQLVRDGHTVVGIARRKNLLDELGTELNSKNFHSYGADVSNTEELKGIFKDLSAKNILPDTVVCGASISEADTDPAYNSTIVRKMMEINFFGTANIVDTFLPEFLKRRHGHFISLSSIASARPNLRGITYPASKAAVGMFFRGLDLKYKPAGTNFSTIYLGPVATTMWEGKQSFVVASPTEVALGIKRIILKPKTISYFPFLSTTLFRISRLIPDTIYAKLSSLLFK